MTILRGNDKLFVRAVSITLAALSFCFFGSVLQRFIKSGDFTFGHSPLERYFAAPL